MLSFLGKVPGRNGLVNFKTVGFRQEDLLYWYLDGGGNVLITFRGGRSEDGNPWIMVNKTTPDYEAVLEYLKGR